MLGKLSVPGRPTNLDNSRARALCAWLAVGAGCGRREIRERREKIFSLVFLLSLFLFPLSVRRSDVD